MNRQNTHEIIPYCPKWTSKIILSFFPPPPPPPSSSSFSSQDNILWKSNALLIAWRIYICSMNFMRVAHFCCFVEMERRKEKKIAITKSVWFKGDQWPTCMSNTHSFTRLLTHWHFVWILCSDIFISRQLETLTQIENVQNITSRGIAHAWSRIAHCTRRDMKPETWFERMLSLLLVVVAVLWLLLLLWDQHVHMPVIYHRNEVQTSACTVQVCRMPMPLHRIQILVRENDACAN